MNKFVLVLMICISGVSYAASNTGVISELYVEESGNMAIKLKGGFPNLSGLCANNSGWAGTSDKSPELKSALLAAKLSQSTVTVSIDKCHETYSSWFKINSIYIK